MSGAARRQWVICPCCQGEGTRNTLGVVDRDDFDHDEWEQYVAGGYDGPCPDCNASGKVLADDQPTIMRAGSDGQSVFYRDADEASEHLLRMAEGWA